MQNNYSSWRLAGIPSLKQNGHIIGGLGGAMSELEKRVEERFGVLPNFVLLAPEGPEITEKLWWWRFSQAAYLDNPLPSLFKERLFVHLSRFCAVRDRIARHVGFS